MATGTTPDWIRVGDDEAVVWESRPHPIELGVGFPAAVAAAFVGLAAGSWGVTEGRLLLSALGAALLAGGVVVAGVRYLRWANTRYVITSSELYEKRGVVSRDVTQFRLDRVQNTRLRQPVLGRALGYGELTVYTAGSGDPELTFAFVPRPERASSVLRDRLEAVAGEEPAV